MPTQNSQKILYIFLDESGNLDFSNGGTKYFVITSITKLRPFEAYKDLTELKYDLIEQMPLDIEYFHAAEDRQVIRDAVFNIIKKYLAGMRIDSLVVEKRKTGPALQKADRFYPEMLGYLLKYVVNGFDLSKIKEVLIFTDSIPIKQKSKVIEKSIKIALKRYLPSGVAYRIFHHASKSNFDLQIVDYCSWAIHRKWDLGDDRSYQYIKGSGSLKSEYDISQNETRYYY